MKKKNIFFCVVIMLIGMTAVLYLRIRTKTDLAVQGENKTAAKQDIDESKIIDGNYALLTETDFLSPEGARLIAEACVSFSDNNDRYSSKIVSAKEVSIWHAEKNKYYIEIGTDDGTRLFFLVPGYKTKYANWIEEIWRDSVGKDGTILLMYVDDLA